MSRVPLIDLKAQYVALRSELRAALDEVCEAQSFVLGSFVERFEAAVSELLGGSETIGVSSGTDALTMALMALRIGPGDEVITTPFSFFATVEAILKVGATPIFVDVDSETLNLDASRAESAITSRTRAVLVVHLFGRAADVAAFSAITQRHEIALVEDAAQAFGVRSAGRALGTWGTFGCYSFFPSKPLGAFGDGGMIATEDVELARKCRRLRIHGARSKHDHVEVGGNYRLDALQAAVLSVKLKYLDRWLGERRRHSAAYSAALSDVPLLRVPAGLWESMPVANYTIRVENGRRDALANHLAERGIETAVHYPRPLHLQPVVKHLGLAEGALPESERAASEVLSLPLYPELADTQREQVVDCIRSFFEGARAR